MATKNKHLPIIGEFEAYEFPKKAIYNLDANEYVLGIGWLQVEKETTVIGEDKDCYIEELRPVSEPTKFSNKIKFLLPIGFHKSRLIRWLPTQIEMFK